jgi:hypothetical protein
LCTTNRGKLLQHKLIGVQCTKKVPEYWYPLYRSTGTRFKKLLLSIVFYYTQEKLFLKHTTRTFRFFQKFLKDFSKTLFAPFHRGPEFVCAFSPRNRDHQQKKQLTAFRDIRERHIYHPGPGIFCYNIQACYFSRFSRHNFPENGPPGPKNGLERRVSQFYTICDKNRLLNINIGKVMAILALRSCGRSRGPLLRPLLHLPANWSCIET